MARRSDEDDADASLWIRIWLRFTVAASRVEGVAKFSSDSPWRVLAFLRELPDQEASVADIAEGTALSERTTTRALSQLERVQYVSRRPASKDARQENLRLTAEGRSAIGKIYQAARPR